MIFYVKILMLLFINLVFQHTTSPCTDYKEYEGDGRCTLITEYGSNLIQESDQIEYNIFNGSVLFKNIDMLMFRRNNYTERRYSEQVRQFICFGKHCNMVSDTTIICKNTGITQNTDVKWICKYQNRSKVLYIRHYL